MCKEEEIIDAIFQNAIRFLNITIEEIINSDFSEINNIVKTSVLVQMTVELSLKYAVAYNNGAISIKKILEKKEAQKNIETIYEEFQRNSLRVVPFDNLKNYIKSIRLFKFNKNEEIEKMEKFQKIRNKLVHFSYNFSPEEILEAKENFIYMISRVLNNQ
ncbi:hypothetical protein HNR77_005349 [Paenibacillus sp. JGP012]|uniref:hypothetical protein n=1 Tax=Paenibacillus sp. JGP012 TaxID=2735914 RepID=UPI00160E3389|nr:hypothetical protein [Paenibacillus sp. JGP012]MBB6024241.1 hypothetical protein [Paenibacillus sp. JGP012]